MSVKAFVDVNVAATIRAGKPREKAAMVEFTAEWLTAHATQADRDALALRVGKASGGEFSGSMVVKDARIPTKWATEPHYSGILAVDDPTPACVIDTIRRQDEKIAEALAAIEAEKVKEETDADLAAIRDALARKVKPLRMIASVCRDGYGITVSTTSLFSGRGWHSATVTGEQPDFDRRQAALRVEGVAEWVAEMEARAELLQAQAVELATQAMLDKEQTNRDAREAEIKAVNDLREWAEANGSERTRRLISGGFDGWHAAAEADYDAACTDAGRVVLDAMIEATGWIEAGDSEDGYTVSGKVEEKRSPSLDEMDALDAVLPFLGPNVSAELIHVTYTPNDDSEDYEDGSEEFSRTEIRVTVNTEFGEWGGFLMSPEFAR